MLDRKSSTVELFNRLENGLKQSVHGGNSKDRSRTEHHSCNSQQILSYKLDFVQASKQSSFHQQILKSKYKVLNRPILAFGDEKKQIFNQLSISNGNVESNHEQTLKLDCSEQQTEPMQKIQGAPDGKEMFLKQDTMPQKTELRLSVPRLKGAEVFCPKVVLYEAERLQASWQSPHSLRGSIGAGLCNLGNTCFLNSTLQCLTYTVPLTNYLLSKEHSVKCQMTGFCMLCGLERHVLKCLNHPGQVIKPFEILQKLRMIAKQMHFGRQEDAHEFLRHVIDAMRKVCLIGHNKLDRYSKETTVINQIFSGFLRSQVICLNCKTKSNTFDPFMDISLEVKNFSTLEAALLHYFRTEHLTGDNLYYCARCKDKRVANKQFAVHKAPVVLTVHLKRFDPGRVYGKVTKHVPFPETLDLRPHMSIRQGDPVMYELYAVLVHQGSSANSGHYFSYVRSPSQKWYCMNDNMVLPVTLQRVLNADAYLLFYICTCQPGSVYKAMPEANVVKNDGQPKKIVNGVMSSIRNSNSDVIKEAASKIFPLQLHDQNSGLVHLNETKSAISRPESVLTDSGQHAGVNVKSSSEGNNMNRKKLKRKRSSKEMEKSKIQSSPHCISNVKEGGNSRTDGVYSSPSPCKRLRLNGKSHLLTVDTASNHRPNSTSEWHVVNKETLASPSVGSSSSVGSTNSTTGWKIMGAVNSSPNKPLVVKLRRSSVGQSSSSDEQSNVTSTKRNSLPPTGLDKNQIPMRSQTQPPLCKEVGTPLCKNEQSCTSGKAVPPVCNKLQAKKQKSFDEELNSVNMLYNKLCKGLKKSEKLKSQSKSSKESSSIVDICKAKQGKVVEGRACEKVEMADPCKRDEYGSVMQDAVQTETASKKDAVSKVLLKEKRLRKKKLLLKKSKTKKENDEITPLITTENTQMCDRDGESRGSKRRHEKKNSIKERFGIFEKFAVVNDLDTSGESNSLGCIKLTHKKKSKDRVGLFEQFTVDDLIPSKGDDKKSGIAFAESVESFKQCKNAKVKNTPYKKMSKLKTDDQESLKEESSIPEDQEQDVLGTSVVKLNSIAPSESNSKLPTEVVDVKLNAAPVQRWDCGIKDLRKPSSQGKSSTAVANNEEVGSIYQSLWDGRKATNDNVVNELQKLPPFRGFEPEMKNENKRRSEDDDSSEDELDRGRIKKVKKQNFSHTMSDSKRNVFQMVQETKNLATFANSSCLKSSGNYFNSLSSSVHLNEVQRSLLAKSLA